MSRVGIWFDGGGKFGFGNIRRSFEMAHLLLARGHQLVVVPLSDESRRLCPRTDLHVDAVKTAVDIVLLDVPYDGDAQVRHAREFSSKIVALDYQGNLSPDVVIALQRTPPMPVGARFHIGIEYAIIRSELRAVKAECNDGNDVLIVVGGGDTEGLAAEIALRLRGLSLCVVQGPNGGLSPCGSDNVRVLESPSNLPALIAQCKWAVTTGGTTMLEMLHLGKATFVIPRTEAEERFARYFLERDALLGLGLAELREPRYEERRRCQVRGPQLIDGQGAERIAAIVEALL